MKIIWKTNHILTQAVVEHNSESRVCFVCSSTSELEFENDMETVEP